MKRLLIALIPFLFINCSSDKEESNKDSLSTDFKIPSWLEGEYIASNGIIAQFPYPATYPYSIKVQNGDFLTKSTKNSAIESFKARVEKYKTNNRLKSVEESYPREDAYKILVTLNPNSEIGETISSSFSIFFAKTPDAKTIMFIYEQSDYGSSNSYYVKK